MSNPTNKAASDLREQIEAMILMSTTINQSDTSQLAIGRITRHGVAVSADAIVAAITAAHEAELTKARIDELKYWQWKTDGHIELSGQQVDVRIYELAAQSERTKQ